MRKETHFLVALLLLVIVVPAQANISQIVYANDSLSAELRILSADFDGTEKFWQFILPQNRRIKVTRINSSYLIGSGMSLYVNENIDIIGNNPSAYHLGVFVDTIQDARNLTFVINGFTQNYSYHPKNPAIIIRYSVIDEEPSVGTHFLGGDVEVYSGMLSTSGYQEFFNTKVTAVLGNGYDHYTCFGDARGGMIRGSNAGYLVISGNPNGYGDKNVYINRYTPNADVILTSSSGNVGIGVDNPTEKLQIAGAIRGSGPHGQLMIRTDSGYVYIGAKAGTTMNFTTTCNKYEFDKPIFTQSGIIASNQGKNLTLQTNFSPRITILQNNGNVGIGTTSPLYKLHVNGSLKATNVNTTTLNASEIVAEDIIVQTASGADFVFDEDYSLCALEEIDSFIKQNKHLPEIQSAYDMQKNGINVNQFQIQLLQKIEELTLYIIKQDARIKELEIKIKK